MTPESLENFLEIKPVAGDELETPVPIIDLEIVEANVKRWQARCDARGLKNRPHIKTHKLVGLARYQLECGAAGITVQKLGEAEVMAAAGISDLFLTFNILGKPKLRRLAALAKSTSISTVADGAAVVEGLAAAGSEAGREIAVLVECDTGGARNGVTSREAAVELARLIDRTAFVKYEGLMTYPAPGTRKVAADFLSSVRDELRAGGLETPEISSGGSPDMWLDEGLEPVTEYRAGTYVYFDRALIAAGACSQADCALKVRATVVSVPTEKRAIVDAGSKALTSDLLGLPDHGSVPELSDARIYKLNEEHGYLDISGLTRKPEVGDIIDILPNHACVVSNLFDRVAVTRGSDLLGLVRVDARGLVW